MCIFVIIKKSIFSLHVALNLKTEFLSSVDRNLGDSWTARVSGRSRGSRPSLVSLILYVYNEGDGAMDLLATTRNTVEEIFGHSTQVGGAIEGRVGCEVCERM